MPNVTTATSATKRPGKKKVNSLAAGRLKEAVAPLLLVGAFVVSGIIFGLMWMTSGDEFSKVNERTGQLTVNFNWGGWMALSAVLYLVAIYWVSRTVEGSRQAKNRLVSGLLLTAFILAMIPLLSLVFSLVVRGVPGLGLEHFFTSDASRPGQKGALHAIVGTLWITLLTTLISVPIGIFTAIYLVEYGKGNFLSRAINFFVDVMTGVPSIVAGLFAYALFLLIVQQSGGDLTNIRSGFVGAIALMVLMIPTVVRSSQEMIRLVPPDLREASYALGVPKWRTIMRVVLPTCLAGLVTGVLLAIARVIGETAPLLVAAGFSINMNTNPFQGIMTSLPVFVYNQHGGSFQLVGNAKHEAELLAWGGAFILLVIVIVLNLIGRVISHYFSPKGNR